MRLDPRLSDSAVAHFALGLGLLCFLVSGATAAALPRDNAAAAGPKAVTATANELTSSPLPTNVVTSTQSTAANAGNPTARVPAAGQPRYTALGNPHPGPLTLDVTTSSGTPASDLLYGLILEDIDHSVEGGLYAELVQNRAFQQGNLDSWLPLGGSTLVLTGDNPLSSALPNYLSIDVSGHGEGFENTGWWGYYVDTIDYTVNIWARAASSNNKARATNSSNDPGSIKVALVSAASGNEFGSVEISIDSSDWKQYTAILTPSSAAPDNNNVLAITTTDDSSATLNFGYISLFPPTYNNRPNGVRPDLMNAIIDLKPAMCRVPGGNNLEGSSIADRWLWNNTIGPLIDRPGRQGDWGYYNTDGMGLLEWLEFCEDLGAETLLGVWAGYALGGESVPAGDLQPYIDEVLHELEYILGSTDTTYGALRAQDGHPDPFELKWVEIGNEDFFSSTYGYRWPAFYNALNNAYPDITFVATTVKGIDLPPGVPWDMHYYGTSSQFDSLYTAYDNWPRNNGTSVIVGEYSVQQYDNFSYALYPFMEGTVAEAALVLGTERNSDVVISQMWAPWLANSRFNQEERPRLIQFDNDPDSVLLSTSYYMLKLLVEGYENGMQILQTNASIQHGPLYWSAVSNAAGDTFHIKLANAGSDIQQVTLQATDATFASASATVISGDQLSANTPSNPTAVQPTSLDVQTREGQITLTLPQWSVAVVTVQ